VRFRNEREREGAESLLKALPVRLQLPLAPRVFRIKLRGGHRKTVRYTTGQRVLLSRFQIRW